MAKSKWKWVGGLTSEWEEKCIASRIVFGRKIDSPKKIWLEILYDEWGNPLHLTPKRAQAIVDALVEEGLAKRPKPIVLKPQSKSQVKGTEMSYICFECSLPYRVDLVVPDDIWEIIKPTDKSLGAGLLCGRCIMSRIEALMKGEAGYLIAKTGSIEW